MGNVESTITHHRAGRCNTGELAKKQARRPSECKMKDANTLLGCHKDIARNSMRIFSFKIYTSLARCSKSALSRRLTSFSKMGKVRRDALQSKRKSDLVHPVTNSLDPRL